jgi:hypothetical protein
MSKKTEMGTVGYKDIVTVKDYFVLTQHPRTAHIVVEGTARCNTQEGYRRSSLSYPCPLDRVAATASCLVDPVARVTT